MGLRHGIGFDNFDPGLVLEAGKVLGGNFYVFVCDALCIVDHHWWRQHLGLRGLSDAIFIVSDLLRDIAGAKTGEAGVLRTSLPVRIVTVPAGKCFWVSPVPDDARHRRVIVGMPIRWNIEIANLSKRERYAASRNSPGHAIIWRRCHRRLNRIRPRRRWLLRRYRRRDAFLNLCTGEHSKADNHRCYDPGAVA